MVAAICIHNATVFNGYSMMKNCAILIKQNKIIKFILFLFYFFILYNYVLLL